MAADDWNPFRDPPEEPLPEVGANESVEQVAEVAPASEDVPPDPGLLFHKDRYGRGIHGWTYNTEPVGVWLEREHKSLTGEQVEKLLISKGMPERDAAWFGGHRTAAMEARGDLAATPALRALAASDQAAADRLARVRAAFLAKQGKK